MKFKILYILFGIFGLGYIAYLIDRFLIPDSIEKSVNTSAVGSNSISSNDVIMALLISKIDSLENRPANVFSCKKFSEKPSFNVNIKGFLIIEEDETNDNKSTVYLISNGNIIHWIPSQAI